jgi:FtsH-binding integral membrane protein
MPSYEQLGFGQGATLTGDRARSVFGHVMALVAVTMAFAAAGAYLTRNINGGGGILFILVAFGGIFGLNAAARRGRESLATGLLFGVGFVLGLAIGPIVADYAHTDPGVVWEAAGSTALFVAAAGAFGYSTRKDLAVYMRAAMYAFIAVLIFGLIALFVAIPGSNIIYCVLMLAVFGAFTAFDFQRLSRNPSYQSAAPIAAAIFLDIFNVFLLLLSLFGGGSSRR